MTNFVPQLRYTTLPQIKSAEKFLLELYVPLRMVARMYSCKCLLPCIHSVMKIAGLLVDCPYSMCVLLIEMVLLQSHSQGSLAVLDFDFSGEGSVGTRKLFTTFRTKWNFVSSQQFTNW